MPGSVGPRLHILIAMSGGVDSSVAAALLKEKGHRVTGVTLSIASSEICGHDALEKSVHDARRVAEFLDIPHHVIDVSETFTETVVEPFVQEYSRGRTPNPCVRCNRLLKFKTLIEAVDSLGADKVATGHYARIERAADDLCHLHMGIDANRDQSYFLFYLSQDQLRHVLFPLGSWKKDAIRLKAKDIELPVADHPDSQEICFIPDDNYAGFIRRNYPETLRPGEILNVSGAVTGRHDGIQFYTIGQRKGIGAHGKRKFVVGIDGETAAVVIGDDEDLWHKEMRLQEMNWIVPPPSTRFVAAAKIRSTTPPAPCDVILEDEGVRIVFSEPQRAITPGQAGVIYAGDEALGGGFIV